MDVAMWLRVRYAKAWANQQLVPRAFDIVGALAVTLDQDWDWDTFKRKLITNAIVVDPTSTPLRPYPLDVKVQLADFSSSPRKALKGTPKLTLNDPPYLRVYLDIGMLSTLEVAKHALEKAWPQTIQPMLRSTSRGRGALPTLSDHVALYGIWLEYWRTVPRPTDEQDARAMFVRNVANGVIDSSYLWGHPRPFRQTVVDMLDRALSWLPPDDRVMPREKYWRGICRGVPLHPIYGDDIQATIIELGVTWKKK